MTKTRTSVSSVSYSTTSTQGQNVSDDSKFEVGPATFLLQQPGENVAKYVPLRLLCRGKCGVVDV